MPRRNSLAFTPIQPEIQALADQHGNDPEAVLEVLKDRQVQNGYLTPEDILDIARALQIPPEKAQGVATFFTMVETEPHQEKVLRVCDGPCCWLNEANQILNHANDWVGEGWRVERTSCLGLCDRAPAGAIFWNDDRVNVTQLGPLPQVWAAPPPPARDGKTSPNALSLKEVTAFSPPHPTYRKPRPGELRVMLSHTEDVDPTSLTSAIDFGEAYLALEAALNLKPNTREFLPQIVIEEVKKAEIRGRGGAGFPVGMKWEMVANETRTPKYIVCNADESEPLVFKDRVLMESKPHQLLEGMALAGYAVGAHEGFIYIRGEYETQARILEHAIQEAETRGYLGNRIRGTDFSFHIHLHRGAGAYICGEETALLESLEGKRGEPRIRPPYPTSNGYHGCPTIVNNVETFCNIPHIVANGAGQYRLLNHLKTPTTKIFTLAGHIRNPGVIEAPYGLTLRQLIDHFGGGMKPGSRFHFALCGGAAGTIVPENLLDTPLDYKSMQKGLSLGAGAFLICDQTVSPVALLRELMWFFEHESCGKCTPCRIGTRQTRLLLDRILQGTRHPDDVERLTSLAELMGAASFCGLGQSTKLPILSALEHFKSDFR